MLDTIRRFFEDRIASGGTTPADSRHRLQLATAALLLEVARADQDVHSVELSTVEQVIARTFQLAENEVNELMQLAEEETRNATSDYPFTTLVNQGFDHADKVGLVEMLWEVAYA